ncbi:MAG: hypothetical protein KF799_01885 [Bdellovibrionales bacterium]|nr:hypothetical protein [Bdellovibrionales bacterium]
MKSFQLVSLLSMAALLISCTGGQGLDRQAVIQCPRNYKPVDMAAATLPRTQQKLEWNNLSTIEPGTYVETSAQLYFEDSEFAPTKNIRVEVRDTSSMDEKTKARTYTASTYCMRNARASMENLMLSVPGISQMTFAGQPSNGSTPANTTLTDSEAREFGFAFNAKGEFKPNSKPYQKPGSTGDIYGTATQSFVVKRSSTEIEIRSTGAVISAEGAPGTYYLSIVLQKQH